MKKLLPLFALSFIGCKAATFQTVVTKSVIIRIDTTSAGTLCIITRPLPMRAVPLTTSKYQAGDTVTNFYTIKK